MAVKNAFNPNPSTVDSLLRERQTRLDLQREQGLVPDAETAASPKPNLFRDAGDAALAFQTPDYADKSFGRKVGEDAALLAYAIPVGLAKIATGLVTHPIETTKELGRGVVQSVKDAVNPDYYKAHPLLGLVNIAGFVSPIAGAAKSSALKVAMRTALNTGVREAVTLGVEETVARTALTFGMKESGGLLVKKGALGNAVWEAAKTGKIEIVAETVKNLLSKAGVADDVSLRIASEMSNDIYTNFSRQTTKMKVLEGLAHPVGSTYRYLTGKIDPIRQALFGSASDTAVAAIYGADVVKSNPEGFVAIERWAGEQVKERGFENTAANRQRIMQEWVEQNSQWAALSPDERIAHFKNYAEQDLIRLQIHNATGIDIVTVKALPQEYIEAMIATLKESPETAVPELTKLLDDNFGNDYGIHSAELSKATTKDGLISAVSKLGDARSAISFSKFSPEVQTMASELEKTGYRIGHAPTNKPVSFTSDIFGAPTVPVIEETMQVGITSAQPASPNTFVTKKLAAGDKLFQAGKVNKALSTLGEVTEGTKGDLLSVLDDGSSVVERAETNTHGLYFGTPEPSFWLKLRTKNITETLASLARYAQANVQDSFITAKKLLNRQAEGSFGLSVRFGKALTNKELVQIEKLVNDSGMGLTLNQATGEAIAYNIQQWDNMSPQQFVETALAVKTALKGAGYKFKASLDKYEIGVYTKDTYADLISKSALADGRAAGGEIQLGDAGRGVTIGGTRGREPPSGISTQSALSTRTAFGNWIERLGLSPSGVIEGAAEFSYRENFTQRALSQLVSKYGNKLKIGKVTIPVAKLFEWIDKNKSLMQQARPKLTLPLRTAFDVKTDDLVRAGFSAEIAADIESISKAALRDVPVSITGMGDAVINYMRTFDKGFGGWMSKWYDNYLKAAYKGRYDWSPFFSAQQFVETKLQAGMFLKDVRMIPGGNTVAKLGDWTAEKLARRVGETTPYLKKIIAEPPLEEVAAVREEILGTLQKTMLDYTSSPDIIGVQNAAKGSYSLLRDKAAFEQSIKSRNFWYAVTGQSSVRMAATFNKALAEKFGMSLGDALAFTYENGVKQYKNPQMVQMMREATQAVFHYQPGIMTSPLMKTLNIIWFPMRFQAKTVQLLGRWMNDISPASRMVVLNNWVHFANWAGTDEGIKWRRTNRNVLYNILAYTTAYEQIGQGIEAVTRGKLFGGNTGLIGGVPFGFMVNLARELAILPEDPDQFDPKTGRRFTKNVPRDVISAASLSVALEQLIISISPSTPFYSLTGGVIGGVSPRKWVESLVRQAVGASREAIEDRDPARGRQMLERDFKRVQLDYTRLAE